MSVHPSACVSHSVSVYHVWRVQCTHPPSGILCNLFTYWLSLSGCDLYCLYVPGYQSSPFTPWHLYPTCRLCTTATTTCNVPCVPEVACSSGCHGYHVGIVKSHYYLWYFVSMTMTNNNGNIFISWNDLYWGMGEIQQECLQDTNNIHRNMSIINMTYIEACASL